MIKYFNGYIVLNKAEQEELLTLKATGGYKLRIYNNNGNDIVEVYTKRQSSSDEYIVATLYGGIVSTLVNFYGYREKDNMALLDDIIYKIID